MDYYFLGVTFLYILWRLKNFDSPLKNYPLTHFPTLALIIGTFSFWIELYVIRLPSGHSSWLAWVLLVFCLVTLCSYRQVSLRALVFMALQSLGNAPRNAIVKIIIAISVFLGLVYLAVGLYASFLPPHLPQEGDALMYHITVPRQHLLHHSFAHISWSVPDLFILTVRLCFKSF